MDLVLDTFPLRSGVSLVFLPTAERPSWPGAGLYYAMLGFTLTVTAWRAEWALLAIGIVLPRR